MVEMNCTLGTMTDNSTVLIIERSTESEIMMIPEDDEVSQILPEDHRIALIIVGIFLALISFFGNSGVLFVVFRRKLRFLYKCSLVSLAFGDLLLGLHYSVVNISRFFLRYSNGWILGELMCSLLPVIQIITLLTNSMTISLIALDRYLAVKGGANKKWEPKNQTCVLIILTIWTVALGAAMPSFFSYDHIGPFQFFTFIPPSTCILHSETVYFCTPPADKIYTNKYLVIIFSLIFLPLFLTFVAFYLVVARYIWMQSVPLSKSRQTTPQSSQDSTPEKTRKSKLSPNYILKTGGNSNYGSRSTLLSDSGSESPINQRKDRETSDTTETVEKQPKKPQTSAQTKRKIRTFKVVLVLIITCFLGRMPSWIYNVTHSFPEIRLRVTSWWILQFWFNLLSLSSTAINPFLYCFLNETLKFSEFINKWIQGVFNSFRSKESEIQNNANQCGGLNEIRQNSIPVSMVPRGPYQHKENRVDTSPICLPVNHM